MTNQSPEIKVDLPQGEKPAGSQAELLQQKHMEMQEAIKLFNEKARFMDTKNVNLKAWQERINTHVADINKALTQSVSDAITKIDELLSQMYGPGDGNGVDSTGKKPVSLMDFLNKKDTSSEYQSLSFKPGGDFAYITLGPDFYGQCPTVSGACIYQYQWVNQPRGGFRFPLFLQPGTSGEFVMNDKNGKRHVMRFSRDAQGNYTKEDGLGVQNIGKLDDKVLDTQRKKERAQALQDDIYKGIDDSINDPIKQGAERNKEKIAKAKNEYESLKVRIQASNAPQEEINAGLASLNNAIKGMSSEQLQQAGISTREIVLGSDSKKAVVYEKGQFRINSSSSELKKSLDTHFTNIKNEQTRCVNDKQSTDANLTSISKLYNRIQGAINIHSNSMQFPILQKQLLQFIEENGYSKAWERIRRGQEKYLDSDDKNWRPLDAKKFPESEGSVYKQHNISATQTYELLGKNGDKKRVLDYWTGQWRDATKDEESLFEERKKVGGGNKDVDSRTEKGTDTRSSRTTPRSYIPYSKPYMPPSGTGY